MAGRGAREHRCSHRLITESRSENASTCRLPAAEIERIVGERIATFLADGSAVFDAIAPPLPAPPSAND